MIDRVELKHRCYVIFVGTDADGGSKKGRVLLGKQRPWLFVPSCWAHQVRVIFDNVWRELSSDRVGRILILAYLVANLTCWTTHCIAFLRLLILQEYLQFAVLRDRGAIIAAQVFLLLGGLYLHFVNIRSRNSLVARIEKRWKGYDQPLYRAEYEQLMSYQGRDPIAVWTALSGGSDRELMNFALTILRVVVNQAGCERLFSHVKETESPRRSCLALCKMEKIAKVSASIKADHLAKGIPVHVREKRKNHKSVAKLLAVPHYCNLIEDEDHIQWWVEMNKWIYNTRAAEFEDEDTDGEEPTLAPNATRTPPKIKNWTKTNLAVLFGGVVKKIHCQIDEAELMEALAEAEEDA
ncbi:hypothetical protein K438DRAFT_1749332 [Mycena galopus ATCC 62051]|nr:hypothetical protein K438DRAFT_1749332 [Mycena galopus ATCC 62051]